MTVPLQFMGRHYDFDANRFSREACPRRPGADNSLLKSRPSMGESLFGLEEGQARRYGDAHGLVRGKRQPNKGNIGAGGHEA